MNQTSQDSLIYQYKSLEMNEIHNLRANSDNFYIRITIELVWKEHMMVPNCIVVVN